MEDTKIKNSANPPLAYSYLRFSRPEQARGDSVNRQLSLTKAYAATHGLKLVESIEDRGVSAFRGQNFKSGALGRFYEKVKSGEIPQGSYLLVESLDRISRQETELALAQFLSIIHAGIVIVAIGDGGRVFRRGEMREFDLMGAIIVMARANEESERKRDRIAKAWEAKRASASGKKMTKRCPAWLTLSEDRKTFSIQKERADLINRIYTLAADGMGNYQITKTLNKEAIPAWQGTQGWHLSSVQKILTNRAVIGEFQPHFRKDGKTGKRLPAGEPIADYYPAIVDEGLFHRVAAIRGERQKRAGKVGQGVSNLFSHICKCGYCGSTVSFVNKGEYKYLVCEGARRGHQCEYVSWPYQDFESLFINVARELDVGEVLGKKNNARLNELHAALASHRGKLRDTNEKLENLANAIAAGQRFETLTNKFAALEAESKRIKSDLEIIEKSIANEKHAVSSFNDNKEWKQLIGNNRHDASFRLRLREEIRRKVGVIKMFAGGRRGILGNGIISELDWNGLVNGFPADARQLEITFNNGAVMILGKGTENDNASIFFASMKIDDSEDGSDNANVRPSKDELESAKYTP